MAKRESPQSEGPESAAPQSALDQLSPSHRIAVEAYANPNSETFGNKKRSMLAARPYLQPDSAAVEGVRLFKRDNVKTAIQEVLEQYNAGYEVRTKALVDLALGRAPQITESETLTPDGEVTQRTRTRRPVSAKVQLEALKKLSQDSGEDEIAHAQNRLLSDELATMGKRMLRQALRAPTDDGDAQESKETASNLLSEPRESASRDSMDENAQSRDSDTELRGGNPHGDEGAEDGLEGEWASAHDIPSPSPSHNKKSFRATPSGVLDSEEDPWE